MKYFVIIVEQKTKFLITIVVIVEKKLSKIHSRDSDNNSFKIGNNKILISIIIGLLIVIAIIGTYAFVNINNNSNAPVDSSVSNVSNSSVNNVSMINESGASDSSDSISENPSKSSSSSNYMKYDPYDYMYGANNNKMYWVENDGSYFHPEYTYGPIESKDNDNNN